MMHSLKGYPRIGRMGPFNKIENKFLTEVLISIYASFSVSIFNPNHGRNDHLDAIVEGPIKP